MPTTRLYLDGPETLACEATVVALRDGAFACDRSCFFPGGGGQPCDAGAVATDDGASWPIVGASVDADGIVWHAIDPAAPVLLRQGQRLRLAVDAARRATLARYHTVLHVLNTIALRDYDGWITGAQIGTEYSRIDFKIDGLSPAMCADLAAKVNAEVAAARPVRSFYLSEAEFAARGDLLRTLEVRPPIVDGRVRIVEIEGFDAQACGGTHVGHTGEIGSFSITRTENKGRINKRLYVQIQPRTQ